MSATQQQQLIYAKFRYTLEPGVAFDEQYVDRLIGVFIGILGKENLSDFVVGFEEENKLGNPVKPHIHICFSTSESRLKLARDRFCAHIRNHTLDQRKRTELYSFKEEFNVRDMAFFFRYAIKQQHPFAATLQKYNFVTSVDFNFKLETFAAHDEYQRNIEFNKAKLARVLKPNAYEKIEKHLLSLGLYHPTEREIIGHITKYSLANRLSGDFAKMMAHCNMYRFQHGLMDQEEAIDVVLKFK